MITDNDRVKQIIKRRGLEGKKRVEVIMYLDFLLTQAEEAIVKLKEEK